MLNCGCTKCLFITSSRKQCSRNVEGNFMKMEDSHEYFSTFMFSNPFAVELEFVIIQFSSYLDIQILVVVILPDNYP